MINGTFTSRRAFLAAVKGLILASPSLPRSVSGDGPGEAGAIPFCSDAPGPGVMLTPIEVLNVACGDCKKLVTLTARRLVDDALATGRPLRLEVCVTVSDDSEEHLFLRVNGRVRDPAQEAGMPVRRVGAFLAEPVWPP